MEEKIKGLEEQIQTYIDGHPDCKVIVSAEKIVTGSRPIKQCGLKWVIIIGHEATDLL